MSKRFQLMAISWIGVLAGLTLLTFALTTNVSVQATMADSFVSVSISEGGFDPAVVTTTVGTAVVWTNYTQETVHLVSGEPYRIYLPLVLHNAGGTRAVAASSLTSAAVVTRQQGDWVDDDIAPGQTCTLTFAISGNYSYFLRGRPDRIGTVVVQEPLAPLFETVLLVDGESGYANAPDSTSLDLGRGDGDEDFTIEAFFYISDLSNDDTVTDLLTRKDGSYSLYINFNSDESDWVHFKLWTGDGGHVILSHWTDLSLGWHHIAAVFDNEFTSSQDLMALYLNGSRVSVDDTTEWTPGIPNSSSELLVGGVPLGAAGFGGLIEEMRFSDIVQYSGASYTVPTIPFVSDANTRALWHFNETAGSTVFADNSGNGNALTGHDDAQTHNPSFIPDFALDVTPDSRTVTQGQSAIYTVVLTSTYGFAAPVTLSVSNLPTDATTTWSANPVTPSGSAVLTVTTTTSTPAGTHDFTVSGTGGGQNHDVQVSLSVELSSSLSLFESVLLVANEGGYANAPDNASLDLGTSDGEDFTIEAFFYVSDLSYDDSYIDLLTRKDESYSLYISFNNGQFDWISFKLWTGDGGNVTLSYLTDISLGWHHLAVVFDNEYTSSEDLLAIYLDGSQVANSADEDIHVDWTPGIPNSSNELLVGGVPFGAAGFNGLIEEMRFSDIVRYSGTLYTVPTVPFSDDASTRALWHFDETAGSTVFADGSDNGNTLTGHDGAQTHNP